MAAADKGLLLSAALCQSDGITASAALACMHRSLATLACMHSSSSSAANSIAVLCLLQLTSDVFSAAGSRGRVQCELHQP